MALVVERFASEQRAAAHGFDVLRLGLCQVLEYRRFQRRSPRSRSFLRWSARTGPGERDTPARPCYPAEPDARMCSRRCRWAQRHFRKAPRTRFDRTVVPPVSDRFFCHFQTTLAQPSAVEPPMRQDHCLSRPRKPRCRRLNVALSNTSMAAPIV